MTHNYRTIHKKNDTEMKENVSDLMREILRKEADAVMAIPVTDGYGEAVDLIVEHVAVRGGKLITSGMGKAGQIAMNIATTFFIDRNTCR